MPKPPLKEDMARDVTTDDGSMIDVDGGCRNGILEKDEACDGEDFGTATCASQREEGGPKTPFGNLTCSDDCKTIGTSLCKEIGYIGVAAGSFDKVECKSLAEAAETPFDGGTFLKVNVGENIVCGIKKVDTQKSGDINCNINKAQLSLTGAFIDLDIGSTIGTDGLKEYVCGVKTDGTIECKGGGYTHMSPPKAGPAVTTR